MKILSFALKLATIGGFSFAGYWLGGREGLWYFGLLAAMVVVMLTALEYGE